MSKSPSALICWMLSWKAFSLLVWLLKYPTSSQVAVKVLVTESRSYQSRFVPVDVPPGVGATAPPRVSMSVQ